LADYELHARYRPIFPQQLAAIEGDFNFLAGLILPGLLLGIIEANAGMPE
jgi:hypothetical protein